MIATLLAIVVEILIQRRLGDPDVGPFSFATRNSGPRKTVHHGLGRDLLASLGLLAAAEGRWGLGRAAWGQRPAYGSDCQ